MRHFKTHKEAISAYEKVREFCGMPLEQWLFDNKTEKREIANSSDVADFIRAKCFIPKDREIFWVVLLDSNHNTMCDPIVVSTGLLNGVMCGVRELFGFAIWWQAQAVVVAHNHPSASIEPSKKDLNLTKDLYDAGKLLGIPVLDHVIVTRHTDSYFSIREQTDIWGDAMKWQSEAAQE